MVAAAVEPLVVTEYETLDVVVEPTELAQEVTAPLRVQLDLGVLVVVERAWLAQDGFGNRELPDVVQQRSGREDAQARCGEPEALADVDGQGRDAACVLLGRDVFLREAEHERTHARAQERFLGLDDVAGTQCAGERARAAAAAQVIRRRSADHRDARQLERVADPPAKR